MVDEFPFGTSQSAKWDYLFRISVCPGNFPVGRTPGTNQKIFYHLHPNRKFREFVVNGKQPVKESFIVHQCKNNAYSKQKRTVTTEIYPRTPTRKSEVNPLGQTDYIAKRN